LDGIERFKVDPSGQFELAGRLAGNVVRLFFDASGGFLTNRSYFYRYAFALFGWAPSADGEIATVGASPGCLGWAIGRHRADGTERYMGNYRGMIAEYQYSPTFAMDEQGSFYVAGEVCNGSGCWEGQSFTTF